jgi:hypothetical protein
MNELPLSLSPILIITVKEIFFKVRKIQNATVLLYNKETKPGCYMLKFSENINATRYFLQSIPSSLIYLFIFFYSRERNCAKLGTVLVRVTNAGIEVSDFLYFYFIDPATVTRTYKGTY